MLSHTTKRDQSHNNTCSVTPQNVISQAQTHCTPPRVFTEACDSWLKSSCCDALSPQDAINRATPCQQLHTCFTSEQFERFTESAGLWRQARRASSCYGFLVHTGKKTTRKLQHSARKMCILERLDYETDYKLLRHNNSVRVCLASAFAVLFRCCVLNISSVLGIFHIICDGIT